MLRDWDSANLEGVYVDSIQFNTYDDVLIRKVLSIVRYGLDFTSLSDFII